MRINSTVGVGSPIARIAVILATTLLMAALGVGALVAGAQSPSPAPADTPPMSFFTGSAPWSEDCPIATPTIETVDGVAKERGESWGCLTWTTDDPRFSGVSEGIWNSDEVSGSAAEASGRPGEIVAGRERIENEAGAWVGTSIDAFGRIGVRERVRRLVRRRGCLRRLGGVRHRHRPRKRQGLGCDQCPTMASGRLRHSWIESIVAARSS